jgi:hypothetical protein
VKRAEEWRTVDGWPDYDVSSWGRVCSRKKARPRLLNPSIQSSGYPVVTLYGASFDIRLYIKVHKLVIETFAGPPADGQVVRHLDGDPINNCLDNLRYGTPAENSQDRSAHGRDPQASRTHCPRGHEYNDANTYRHGNHRYCRPCHRISDRLRHERRLLASAGVLRQEQARAAS